MSLNITSPSSLFIDNQINRTQSAIAKSLQRLSTGLRVNSFADDVQAAAEAVTLQAAIGGYAQAVRNVNDAVGLLNTADSALGSQMEIIQKLRELAVQASNGSLSTTDRSNINTQVQALLAEFNRITTTTQFNGINLIDGSFGAQTIQIGSNSGDSSSIQINSEQSNSIFQKTIGSGAFQSRKTYGTGTTDQSVAAADFNGDGNQDLVTADNGSATVSVLLGKGDATFQTRVTYSVGTNPAQVVVGDVNGDGITDIVTADTGSGDVSILLGNGDGTFKPRTSYAVGSNVQSVVLADLNHDGKLDIVTADGTGDQVSILLGNGDGTFGTRQTIAVGAGTLKGIQVADFNGDGNMDLVVGRSDASTAFYTILGNGNGTFQAAVAQTAAGNSPDQFAVADVNGDGNLDIISADTGASNNYSISLGNGNGTFQAAAALASGVSPTTVTLADINGDGVLDLIGAGTTNVETYLGNGNGTFQSRVSFANGSTITKVIATDLNKDGVTEIITADSGDGTISVNVGNSVVTSAQSDVNTMTQAKAQKLIPILDTALTNIKNNRALIAAYQNRLSQTLNQDTNMNQNLSDAKSSATSVDIAAETSNLVRNQILAQAQVAALGQANVNEQVILKLLQNF